MLELLAPGGSYEGMMAAVNAGADAVYMGGTKFGARAYAQNPEEKGLLEAMDYCHMHGRKLYLTVNTLLKETELEQELYDYLLPLYTHGLDAVLVQDFGVFEFIRREFPELPLHASTQMTITGADGAKMLKKLGAERIVPSRELSLEEIREIHRETEIEIECFVHGALCYCYSGQCLMSSLIGGRSGNRGRCAQPCRLPYELYRDGVRQNTEKERYLLSLKDICTLSILPELIEAGVCSFKIEGRMKRAEYAAGVVEIYRKYLDLYQEKGRKGYRVQPEDEKQLMDLYNRGGFSQGYYKTWNGKDMMSMQRPNHWGTPAASVTSVKNGQVWLKALEDLWNRDALEIRGEQEADGKELLLKEKVPKGREFLLPISPRLVKNGQKIYRVRCEALLERLREDYLKRKNQEKINGKFILNLQKPAILSVEWNGHRVTVTGEAASPAQNRPLEEETVRRQLMKTGNTPFMFEKLEICLGESLFYPMQSLNELRRQALERLEEEILTSYQREKPFQSTRHQKETERQEKEKPELRASVEEWEQLDALLEIPEIEGIYLDCSMFGKEKENKFSETVQRLHEKGKKAYLMLPQIWRKQTVTVFEQLFLPEQLKQADGFLLRSSEQLEYFQRKEELAGKERIADAGIYTYNQQAREFLKAFDVSRDTVPLECNRRELRQRSCRGSEMMVYGFLPLMVTTQCLVKNTAGCRKIPGRLKLRDRKNAEFLVKNHCCFCSNVIYNSVPLDLISDSREVLELAPASCRMAFTFETKEETQRIANAAAACFREGKMMEKVVPSGTKGHFKRGVE